MRTSSHLLPYFKSLSEDYGKSKVRDPSVFRDKGWQFITTVSKEGILRTTPTGFQVHKLVSLQCDYSMALVSCCHCPSAQWRSRLGQDDSVSWWGIPGATPLQSYCCLYLTLVNSHLLYAEQHLWRQPITVTPTCVSVKQGTLLWLFCSFTPTIIVMVKLLGSVP